MTEHVIKPDPDTDEYVLWSTNTASPIAFGTRNQMMVMLANDGNTLVQAVRRLQRADTHGSSALWPSSAAPAYGWDHKEFLMMEVAGGPGLIDRRRLSEWCRQAMDDDSGPADETGAARLLRPLPSDE